MKWEEVLNKCKEDEFTVCKYCGSRVFYVIDGDKMKIDNKERDCLIIWAVCKKCKRKEFINAWCLEK